MILIHELKNDEFQLVRHLFADIEKYNLSVRSVFEKNYRGRIFVDSKEKPSSGFMYLGRRTFNFVGSSENTRFIKSLMKVLKKDIFPNNREKGSKKFMIFFDDCWEKEITSLFEDLSIEERMFYNLKREDKKKLEYTLSPEFMFERVDSDFIEKKTYIYPDEIPVERWITYLWGTHENFFSKAFAFAIVYDEKLVVSTSFCNYLAEDMSRCEIGIITKSDYHRKGLGKNLITHVLEYCWQQEIDEVEWHTAVENIASRKLAESVGFKFSREYKIYYSDWL